MEQQGTNIKMKYKFTIFNMKMKYVYNSQYENEI